jgi:hypothetical protein
VIAAHCIESDRPWACHSFVDAAEAAFGTSAPDSANSPICPEIRRDHILLKPAYKAKRRLVTEALTSSYFTLTFHSHMAAAQALAQQESKRRLAPNLTNDSVLVLQF